MTIMMNMARRAAAQWPRSIATSSSLHQLHARGIGAGKVAKSEILQNRDPQLYDVISRLQNLGTGQLCDADKVINTHKSSSKDDSSLRGYEGLNLMDTDVMKLRHKPDERRVMVGVARTVQLPRPNDFLAVLHALTELSAGDVLVVNTSGSMRAVAGSLFTTEARRRGVSGIVVDGPIRDIDDLDCFAYSTKITPYAGTVQHVGEGIDTSPVQCAGITVNPGDIIFADSDGVLCGSIESFSACLHDAEHITAAEQRLIEGMKVGVSLHSMTNFDEHLAARKEGRESSLTFKDLHTIKFKGIDAVEVG